MNFNISLESRVYVNTTRVTSHDDYISFPPWQYSLRRGFFDRRATKAGSRWMLWDSKIRPAYLQGSLLLVPQFVDLDWDFSVARIFLCSWRPSMIPALITGYLSLWDSIRLCCI